MYPITFFLGSLLALLISCVVEASQLIHNNWIHTLNLLLKEIGIALFIVATITIVLEISDFKEYFIQRLQDIIVEDDYIQHLTPEKLERIHDKIENRLYNGDQRTEPSSFYCKVQKEITDFVGKCYYEDMDITVECSVVEIAGKRLFKKIIHRKVDIVNPTQEKVMEVIPVGSSLPKIDGLEKEELYILHSVRVDSKDITESLRCDIQEIITNDPYCIDADCDRLIEIPSSSKKRVETITETRVPLDDIHYWHRIMKPCKQYRVSFIMNDDNYVVGGTGFGFLHGVGLIKQMLTNRLKSGLVFRFNDWILPGDGVIFTITPKNSSSFGG